MPNKQPKTQKSQPAVTTNIRYNSPRSSVTKNLATAASSVTRNQTSVTSSGQNKMLGKLSSVKGHTLNEDMAKQHSSFLKSQSTYTGTSVDPYGATGSGHQKTLLEMKDESRKSKAECEISASTSHTQFFRKPSHEDLYARITTDEFLGVSESLSGSSDTYRCVHGSKGKIYSEKGLLKRNLIKELDPISNENRWTHRCKPSYGWDVAEVLAFLVNDPTVEQQKERLYMHLKDLIKMSNGGYRIDHLDEVCTIISYLIETLPKDPNQKDLTTNLLQNMAKPIQLNNIADVVKHVDQFTNYFGFLGYLLMRLGNDSMFDVISQALYWHLSAPDSIRSEGSARRRHTIHAAAPMLFEVVSRMLAVASSHRFPAYLKIALILASNSYDNCMELMRLNIIENIFYRFNPYFPEKMLPSYDINPDDPEDINVKLGDSTIHMSNTISILQVLLKSTKDFIAKNPKDASTLPCPDDYAQRCFIWAFRYECRGRARKHQRKIFVSIAHVLLHCFGVRLGQFSERFMPDILSLCVLTELPPRNDWTNKVGFGVQQGDVQFKKLLIYLSVCLIKVFPQNRAMIESRHYLLGLMYLLDPGLCYLRMQWAPSLFAELRKASLQALVCTVPRLAPHLVEQYGLIRRIMWYIEWYSESPYELSILYWCLRLLQVSIYGRGDKIRQTSMKSLFDTHGIIILIHLCHTLLEQKTPPIEKSQAIIALCLRLLTSAVEYKSKITCCVYPAIKWPSAINALARRMIDVVLYSLEKNFIISDRWLIALLNFIWEAIIWRKDYREKFIVRDGIYKLLDIITMTRGPVQCIALALVCDATRAGDAVGQLVTWRAGLGAHYANPNVVKRGCTIATLLATIFRDECKQKGVELDFNGIITNLETPIMSSETRERLEKYERGETLVSPPTVLCMAAADLAGSRMSKAYALLSMLSEDLEYKVSLADEAYNMYKNIHLEPEDETILVLCAHYLTMKLNEVWVATKVKNPGFLSYDDDILEEFLHIGRGWGKEIKRQQKEVLQMDRKKQSEEENSLYEFLARVRLNISLDALQEVRNVARSADRARMTHAQIHDAVKAHHRRSVSMKTMQASVIRTYKPPLDDRNITGQNVKVFSIHPKDKPKPMEYVPSTSS